MKHDAVAVAHGLYVGCQVEADGSVADGVHCLGVKEVVGPRWWERRNCDEKRHENDEKHNANCTSNTHKQTQHQND